MQENIRAVFRSAAHRDGNGDTDEEQIGTKSDVLNAFVVPKLIIETPSEGATQGKRQSQASKSDRGSHAPVAHKEANIGLETNEEEVKNETEIGDQCQVGNRVIREDGGAKVGNAAHNRRGQTPWGRGGFLQ